MTAPAEEPATEDNPRLVLAIKEYLAELEAGRRPDRQALAGRFPDLAEEMVPYLDALEMVHGDGARLQPPGARPAPEPPPAEPIGDFRIVREVGRGGMGIVYEALQLSLGR